MLRTALFTALLALAAHTLPSPQSDSQCETGALTCCDTTYPANSTEADVLMRSLNLDASSYAPDTLVAAACGGGGVNVGGDSSCAGIRVCCEDNSFGLIAVGCTVVPVNV